MINHQHSVYIIYIVEEVWFIDAMQNGRKAHITQRPSETQLSDGILYPYKSRYLYWRGWDWACNLWIYQTVL